MSQEENPQNLVFIWTDQQSANTLGCYGNDIVNTENLDEFAASATQFNNPYVSQPVCTPSRSTVMTGLYPHSTGMTENNLTLPSNVKCFPELGDFDDYATGFIGKWHLGDEIFPQHGFDEWVSIEGQYREFYAEHQDTQKHCDYYHFLRDNGFEPDVTEPDGFEWFSRTFSANLPEEYSKPAFMADEAQRFIREHRDEPFILHVMFLEPHEPYTSPRDDQYDPDTVPLPPNFEHEGFEDQPLRIRLIREAIQQGIYRVPRNILGENPTEDDWRQLISRYWGLVSLVDTHVGRILDTLDSYGLADDTVVVYTSDHGDMVGSHQLASKMVMFQEAIRVPLLIRIPGIERTGETIDTPVSHVDLIPTLLDVLGEEIPDFLQGQSWLPFLRNERELEEENVFIEWNGPNVAGIRGRIPRDMSPDADLDTSTLSARPYVKPKFAEAWADMADPDEILEEMLDPIRTVITPDGWKYNYHQSGPDELYDLDADPHEMENLVGDQAYADVIEELQEEIYRWQRETRDPVYFY